MNTYKELTDEQLTEIFFSNMRMCMLNIGSNSTQESIEWFRNHIEVWIVEIYFPDSSLSVYVDTLKLEELVGAMDVEAPCFIKGLFINTRNVKYIDVKMLKRKEDDDTQ